MRRGVLIDLWSLGEVANYDGGHSSQRYEHALQMEEIWYIDEPNHPDLATTVSNLAGLRKVQGRLTEAAEGDERALRMQEMAYADEPDHPDLATTVHNLAGVQMAQGRLAEAAEGYERALRIEQVVFADEPGHPDLEATVRALASVREAQRSAEAGDGVEAVGQL